MLWILLNNEIITVHWRNLLSYWKGLIYSEISWMESIRKKCHPYHALFGKFEKPRNSNETNIPIYYLHTRSNTVLICLCFANNIHNSPLFILFQNYVLIIAWTFEYRIFIDLSFITMLLTSPQVKFASTPKTW